MKWVSVGTLVATVAAVAALARPPRSLQQHNHVAPLLPRAGVLRAVGASHVNLLADYYWLQATYLTGKAWSCDEYGDIAAYADLVTDLDPRFAYPYYFGGVVAPCNLGRETWVNTDPAAKLLEKGLEQFPSDLRLRIALAYSWSSYQKKYREAARLLEETSRMPGAPAYLPALATRLYAQSGDVESGLIFAQGLAESGDEDTRAFFERRIGELRLERELIRLDQAVASFRAREGRLPTVLAELVTAGDLAEVPRDPLGGALYLGKDGRAYSTSAERRLEVHLPGEDD